MLKSFVLLLLPVFVFGQYGPELVTNGNFSVDASWTKEAEWTIGSGTANCNAVTAKYMYQNVGAGFEVGKTYRGKVKITSLTSGSMRIQLAGVYSPSFTTSGWHDFTTVRGNTYYTLWSLASGFVGSVDSVSARLKIDSLFVFASGNDSNADTVLTLTEAFMKRGAHAGGVFITESGTYDETVMIDSSFAKWVAVGGAVEITAVDFNNVTCTVDNCIYENITTVSNASNVTIDYSVCAAPSSGEQPQRKYRHYSNWQGFRP